MTFYQVVVIHKTTWLLKGQEGVRDLFSLYIYIENFKNLLVRNHWTNFNISEILDNYVALDHKIYKNLKAMNLGECASLFAQESDIGPSWSSCSLC